MKDRKHKSLVGRKFGKLTVLKEDSLRIRNLISWDCICDCGNTHKATGSSLTAGNIRSCGCLINDKALKNKVGEKFGSSLIVEELAPKLIGKAKKKRRVFLCKCKCGKERPVSITHLKSIGKDCSSCRVYVKKNLTKNIFGNYKVLNKVKNEQYLCECVVCKNRKEFTRLQLKARPKQCDICTNNKKNDLFKSKATAAKLMQVLKLEKLNDYVGKTYNRLTITKIESKSLVRTVCNCGKIPKPTSLYNILNNIAKSCGCIKVEACKRRSGKNHPNWCGGTYHSESEKIRRSTAYKKWRNDVFMRDSYTCEKCGLHNVSTLNGIKTLSYNHNLVNTKLTAHHFLSFKDNNELRLTVDNGITLCKECHDNFHIKYGNIGFTFENFVDYINNR